MIQTEDKSKCCGCGACESVCPKKCISMHGDKEGCLYPVVDMQKCVHCGLCEQVCPELKEIIKRMPNSPIKTFAAVNPDSNVRRESSSGGVFSLLAEKIISEGGVVFGARMSADGTVEHCCVENFNEIRLFRGSKYVQSRIGKCYGLAKQYLDSGRKVLFSGTPCQIAGLRGFLRKDYSNLIMVDFVCHGVPAPMVWRKYLKTISRLSGASRKNSVSASSLKTLSYESMSFRDKRNGWKKYGFRLPIAASKGGRNTVSTSYKSDEFYEYFASNKYMQMFLSDLSLRPSCYDCPSKGRLSGSDITIGDFWGIEKIHPEIDDDLGMSLVMINTRKGNEFYTECGAESWEKNYSDAVRYNPAIECSAVRPAYRDLFMVICRCLGFDFAYRCVRSQALPVKVARRGYLLISKMICE